MSAALFAWDPVRDREKCHHAVCHCLMDEKRVNIRSYQRHERIYQQQYLLKINDGAYTLQNACWERIHGRYQKRQKNRWGDILVEGSKIRADRVGVRAFQVCSLKDDTRLTIPTEPIPITR